MKKSFFKLAVALSAGLLSIVSAFGNETIPEPATVLYGKVLHRAFGHELQLSEGTLEWVLTDSSGQEHLYATDLENISDVFSYRLGIPHQALATGLTFDNGVLPLGVQDEAYTFSEIRVNGQQAEILVSEVDFLELFQNARGATHRIDLVVNLDLLDSDGDGIPDWWEELNGSDPHVANAGDDIDGDGISLLNEYFNGLDPNRDDRTPSILTASLSAFAESSNGVWLNGVDANSVPSELVYTITQTPLGGQLLALGEESIIPLSVGDSFTQADLNSGRVTFDHSDIAVTVTSLGVTLSDGVNQSDQTDILISVFPEGVEEIDEETGEAELTLWWQEEASVFAAYWGLRNDVLGGGLAESALIYFMGRTHDWTLWDYRENTLPVTIVTDEEKEQFVLGGSADDRLAGSSLNDIINGGAGDDTLSGNGGADLFIMNDLDNDTITDFSVDEDIIDLTLLLDGEEGELSEYLSVTQDGTDTVISLNQSGDLASAADATVTLQNVTLNADGLNKLWAQGQLLTGAVQGVSLVTFDFLANTSLEEGLDQTVVSISRQGPTNTTLTAGLTISGSAQNGVDYHILFDSVQFGVGVNTVELPIEPITDTITEGPETLTLTINNGSDYSRGDTFQQTLTILDSRQRFEINAVQNLAVVNEEPGILLITRQGPISNSTTVFLTIGGEAERNIDYQAISTFVSFGPNQVDAVIPVIPFPSATLSQPNTSRLVEVSIRPSFGNTYSIGDSGAASVRLLSDSENFAQWVNENQIVNDGSSGEELEQATSTRSGVNALVEYALSYGLNLDDGVSSEERAQFVPQLTQDEAGERYVEYTQRLNDPSLNYTLERSSDLITWVSGEEYFEEVDLDAAKSDSGQVCYRLRDTEDDSAYVRVSVTLND